VNGGMGKMKEKTREEIYATREVNVDWSIETIS
jgi:hypothetical protein